MKYSTLFFVLICVMFAPIQLYAGQFISDIGFVAECPLEGDDNLGALGRLCETWCDQNYAEETKNGITYKYGSPLASYECKNVDMESNYKYCCANFAASQIVSNCTCSGSNQITIKNSDQSWDVVVNGDGTYKYVCMNYYCFCNTAYYGPRQLMNVSTDGTCTKCPCVADTYRQTGGSQVCGWTANNYQNLKNPDAPSTTIKDCKAGPVTSAMPEQYRTYFDPSGVFVLSGPCNYTE